MHIEVSEFMDAVNNYQRTEQILSLIHIFGSGVAEVLDINKKSIAARVGDEVELKYVLDLRDFEGDPIDVYKRQDPMSCSHIRWLKTTVQVWKPEMWTA